MNDVVLFGAIRSKITKPGGGALMKEQGGGGSAGGRSCARSTGGGSSGRSDVVGVVVEVSTMFAVAVSVETVGIVAVQK
jgi:hypothetical protein